MVADARRDGEAGRKASLGGVSGGGVGLGMGRGSSVSNSGGGSGNGNGNGGGAAMVRAGSSGAQALRAGSVMQRAAERLGLERSPGSVERNYGMFARK